MRYRVWIVWCVTRPSQLTRTTRALHIIIIIIITDVQSRGAGKSYNIMLLYYTRTAQAMLFFSDHVNTYT